MKIKNLYRIARIWRKGKLPYAKRVRKWIKGRFIRELQLLNTTYYSDLMKKYGEINFTAFWWESNKNVNKP